jgi:formylmethanofuran dehydrogenase subunit D
MKSSNASSAAFGWDFQCNAAIMLMLKNINVASAVKVEGQTEDIEIILNSGNAIYSQAKAVFNPYDDYSNVISKLKSGLRTLNNAAHQPNIEQLIYVTNSPNPFNQPQTIGAFSGELTSLNYNNLPESCKQEIEKLCAAEDYGFDRQLFSVYVMQFHGDGENRYKVIKGLINEFLNLVGLSDLGLGKHLLDLWQGFFFTNASQHDATLKITKEQMIWPLIVSICDLNTEDALLADYDEGDIDNIIRHYGSVINNNSERFEFVSKVLSCHNSYEPSMKSGTKTKMFIENCWSNYSNDFDVPTAELDVFEVIVKLAISNVIKRRDRIVKIKAGVNL